MSAALARLSQYADTDSDDDTTATSKSAKLLSPPDAQSAKLIRDVPIGTAVPGRPKRKLQSLDEYAFDRDTTPLDQTLAGNKGKKVARGEWLCYCFVEGESEPLQPRRKHGRL